VQQVTANRPHRGPVSAWLCVFAYFCRPNSVMRIFI